MTFDEFITKYNMAPYEVSEFAEAAIRVENYPYLKARAEEFLENQKRFVMLLENMGVKIG